MPIPKFNTQFQIIYQILFMLNEIAGFFDHQYLS